MSVVSASPAQLAELSNFVVNMRSVIASFSHVMNQMNALNNGWNATISAIIGTPAGTTIVDATNLAGAVPLTDTTVAALVADIQAILTTYYTAGSQQTYAQVCGPMNTL